MLDRYVGDHIQQINLDRSGNYFLEFRNCSKFALDYDKGSFYLSKELSIAHDFFEF